MPPSRIAVRQRRLYDDLWASGRGQALTPDLMRFAVWRAHLRSPVVDVGAGDGLLARSFPSLSVISIDLSETGIRHLASPAVAGAAEALPLRAASARTVVLSEVLEHAEDPARVLSECRRVLTGDGRLLISVPLWPIAHAALVYFWRKIGERPTLANLSKWDPGHERRYRIDDLLAQLEAAGLGPIQVTPLFGSPSSAAFYGVEPLLAKMTGRQLRLAPRLVKVDRIVSRFDHPSDVAVVCRSR